MITPLLQQAHTAQNALTRAVDPEPKTEEVRLDLTVTKAWLRQLVLALLLICHGSYRGVVELLREFFGNRIFLRCPSAEVPDSKSGPRKGVWRASKPSQSGDSADVAWPPKLQTMCNPNSLALNCAC